MGTAGLHRLIYYFIFNSPFIIGAKTAFTEVPKDVSVGEGEDVEMPCAFKAVSSAPMSLEIQWWYLKGGAGREAPHGHEDTAKDAPREATKISTVRVQGNAISHRLSLSKVKKEDEGVYECHVSDLWADETQEFTVHATLSVAAGDGMVAEEAVSHIQNRWPLRNTNTVLAGGGAGTSDPGYGLAGGQRPGKGKHRLPQQAQPGLLPSISSTTVSVAKSSASPMAGNAAIVRQLRTAGCSITSMMDPVLCIILLFLHSVLPYLLAH